MTTRTLKAIVRSELSMAEDELTPEQRIDLAIDLTLRLLGISIEAHSL